MDGMQGLPYSNKPSRGKGGSNQQVCLTRGLSLFSARGLLIRRYKSDTWYFWQENYRTRGLSSALLVTKSHRVVIL